MASSKLAAPKDEENVDDKSEPEPPLPQTLVRIPTQHAPALIPPQNSENATE